MQELNIRLGLVIGEKNEQIATLNEALSITSQGNYKLREQIPKLEAAARMALIQMLKQAEEMPCHYDDYFEAITALRKALK